MIGSGLRRKESLGFHGGRTQLAFYAALERKLKGLKMSPVEYISLSYLMNVGPVSQGELAEYLTVSGATAVRLVDRLVRDGWAAREANPNDGRVKLLVPTGDARELWKRISNVGDEVLEDAYEGIDPSDIELVKRILAKVRSNLGADS